MKYEDVILGFGQYGHSFLEFGWICRDCLKDSLLGGKNITDVDHALKRFSHESEAKECKYCKNNKTVSYNIHEVIATIVGHMQDYYGEHYTTFEGYEYALLNCEWELSPYFNDRITTEEVLDLIIDRTPLFDDLVSWLHPRKWIPKFNTLHFNINTYLFKYLRPPLMKTQIYNIRNRYEMIVLD